MKQRKPNKEPRKPQFVVDHNSSLESLKKDFGNFAKFISSVELTGAQDTEDSEIVRIANNKDYHVITLNTKDFLNFPVQHPDLKIGLICVNLQEKVYHGAFAKILRDKQHHRNYHNKLIILGNPVKTFSYKNLRAKGFKD